MSVGSMNRVMQRIRQVVDGDDPCECDAELLGRFLTNSDSRAVSLLFRRHASMVWGVCRRILVGHQDAEDAFQATFLVLLRKANTIKPRSMVGNWLHGVALQTALKARAMTMKRSTREKPMATVPDSAPKAIADHPLLAFLDEELNRLPEKYRVALVLCDLEGKTRAEAARELGWAEGTVSSSLARGRQMLARRLGRHGAVISVAAISALLANNVASSAPAAVVATTVQAAVTIVSAKTVVAAGLSQHVMTLADGVVKTMLLSKLKSAFMVVLVLGFIVTGAAVLTSQMLAALGDQSLIAEEQPAAEQQQDPKREKDAFTAWGKEINGLQAGLGFRPGEKRAYTHGETVKLVVRVRNVSKKETSVEYISAYFFEYAPSVTNGKGKDGPPIRLPGQGGDYNRKQVNVAPGKEIELAELNVGLKPESESGNKGLTTLYGTGKFLVHYERLMYRSGKYDIGSILSELATGKLELEIKSDPPAATEEKTSQKQEKDPPKKFANSLGMEFALVPKGKSWLGGGDGKEGTNEVNIAQDFYMGIYLVTQEEWEKVTGKRPSKFSRSGAGKDKVRDIPDQELMRFPVESISWEEAKAFVKLLNKTVEKEPGWEYRLPTEEQWEYACRGGPMTNKAESAFNFYFEKPSNTLSKHQANFLDSGLNRPCKVGSYSPNRLGLFDMHGNLVEWCEDLCDPTGLLNFDPKLGPSRVWVGGGWNYPSDRCHAAHRHGAPIAYRYDHLGFRVALVPSTKGRNATQDADPEKLYRTMENKVRAAKSLHVALDSKVDSQANKGKAKATIYATEGNKSRMEIEFDIDGKAEKLLFLTDGKAQYTKQGDKGTLDANPKKATEQAKLVPVVIARIGITGAMLMARSVKPGEEKEFDLDKDAPVTNFNLGAKEMVGDRPAQVVTYQLDFNGKSAMTVWIDTKTQLPLKRVIAVEEGGQKFRITETYSTFAIDSKLEPKLFEIPTK